jgi:hypothetical protein
LTHQTRRRAREFRTQTRSRSRRIGSRSPQPRIMRLRMMPALSSSKVLLVQHRRARSNRLITMTLAFTKPPIWRRSSLSTDAPMTDTMEAAIFERVVNGTPDAASQYSQLDFVRKFSPISVSSNQSLSDRSDKPKRFLIESPAIVAMSLASSRSPARTQLTAAPTSTAYHGPCLSTTALVERVRTPTLCDGLSLVEPERPISSSRLDTKVLLRRIDDGFVRIGSKGGESTPNFGIA